MKIYNYKKIKQEVSKIVKEACYSKNNKFGNTVWLYHILPVVEHSLTLGKELKGSSAGSPQVDLEVLELAALLHDYAGTLDYRYYQNHHTQGAKIAGKILREYDFPSEKIKKIQECIISHRGSVNLKKKSIEAKILASADAMSHITELFDMCYLTFNIHKYETLEGARWLKNKLARSWDKTMPAGKKLIKADYEQALKIINKVIARAK